jgi:hypothetical protein
MDAKVLNGKDENNQPQETKQYIKAQLRTKQQVNTQQIKII